MDKTELLKNVIIDIGKYLEATKESLDFLDTEVLEQLVACLLLEIEIRNDRTIGKYQATDMIINSGHGEGFTVGNIMKYAMRYGKKDNKKAELYKIIHYAIIALYLEDSNGRR